MMRVFISFSLIAFDLRAFDFYVECLRFVNFSNIYEFCTVNNDSYD